MSEEAMTDYSELVERLRDQRITISWSSGIGIAKSSPEANVLCAEAAAAIEAQRQELDEARAELAKVRERIERLEGALQRIADKSAWDEVMELKNMARAALEAAPDFWALATEHGDEVAAPEAGAGQVYCPRCHDYECVCVQQTIVLPAGSITDFGHCIQHGDWSRTFGNGCPGCNGEVAAPEAGAGQVYCPRCHDYECVCVQQSPAQPEEGK